MTPDRPDSQEDQNAPPLAELGKKDEIFGAELLQPLQGIYDRPTRMPHLPEGHRVICGYNQGLGERIFVCNTLEGMQELYDAYDSGGALSIRWYSGKDPGFIAVM